MGGLFASDKDKSWNKRIGEVFSRHTFQQPFTNIGYWFGNLANITGEVEVEYFHGATVTNTSFIDGTGGITLGSNIMLSKGSNVDFSNTTLIHEYGHYLQQRKWGALPYLSLSLASILSAGPGWRSVSSHDQVWSEMDASARGLDYFESRMDLRDINNFKNIFQYRDYYNGRFLRNYFANDIFTYLLLDITWSK
jgi:hypothetical protein